MLIKKIYFTFATHRHATSIIKKRLSKTFFGSYLRFQCSALRFRCQAPLSFVCLSAPLPPPPTLPRRFLLRASSPTVPPPPPSSRKGRCRRASPRRHSGLRPSPPSPSPLRHPDSGLAPPSRRTPAVPAAPPRRFRIGPHRRRAPCLSLRTASSPDSRYGAQSIVPKARPPSVAPASPRRRSTSPTTSCAGAPRFLRPSLLHPAAPPTPASHTHPLLRCFPWRRFPLPTLSRPAAPAAPPPAALALAPSPARCRRSRPRGRHRHHAAARRRPAEAGSPQP
ncbi:hypothetical protein PVAP13_3NG278723 [Panicum virgatum]|uniref:Uncharacterized protein n=1 Tax=Panicum virgatum TaxID=38727 RepID=A0A8T0UPI7_PANVG|nr:hypothetical protein PVAP13_3NG278723 [Panicum virgatum]